MLKNNDEVNNHLLSFVWLMLFIMPNNMMFYIFVPVAFIVLYRLTDYLPKTIFLGLLIGCLSFNLLCNLSEDYLLWKDKFRVIVLILLFISFARLKGEKILKQYIYVAILFLVLTQMSFAFNISFITDIVKTFYAEGSEYAERKLTNYYSYDLANYGIARLGGIFFNPNQYARNLELIFITLLCESKQFRRLDFFILIPIIIFSILATGSRTSLIVLIIIIIMHFYSTKIITVRNFFIIGLIAGILIPYLMANTNLGDFRSLKIDEGMDNSFGIKLQLLSMYFKSIVDPMTLIIGNISYDILIYKYGIQIIGTDFDIGNIIILYGFSFFILYTIFCIIIYKKMLPQYRIVFCILIWMFSSSIICSYRMAPSFILILGLYYRRSLIEKSKCLIKNTLAH